MQADLKTLVRQYWDTEPCGTRGVNYPEGTPAYYEEIRRHRYSIELCIPQFAEFERWRGRKVLEVGCGVGTDLVEFVRHGAVVTGIDFSPKSVQLAQRRLDIYKLKGEVLEADAEQLPFSDNTFGMVWSFGVLHHTPNTVQAVKEIHRVLKPNGEARVMLYHKPSMVCLQMHLMFGFRNIDDLLAHHHESIGTKAYSVGEVKRMFSMFNSLSVETAISAYDIRYARGKYLPLWFMNFVPKRFGWYVLARGRK